MSMTSEWQEHTHHKVSNCKRGRVKRQGKVTSELNHLSEKREALKNVGDTVTCKERKKKKQVLTC